MKIQAIETIVSWAGLRNWLLVKITTDTGIYGWGEGTLEGKENTVAACIQEVGAILKGADPLEIERHWQVMVRHGFWRGGAVLNSAVAALDQALWDIRGKAWSVPVYKMLGGPARDRVRVYTHVGNYDPDRIVDDAQRDIDDGYTAMKTGSWADLAPLSESERLAVYTERIARLRESVGPAIDIMVDDHGRGRSASAARLVHALQPYGLLFLEEVTQPDDIEALAILRDISPRMNLATGERLYSKWDYRPLLERRLVDVIQPDLCHAGGITECKKIAAMAEAYYVQVAPHNPQGPVSTAAAAHLAMAIPNFLILEYDRQDEYRKNALMTSWPVESGYLHVPDLPGLGIEFDENVLQANPQRPVGGPRTAFATDGSVMDV